MKANKGFKTTKKTHLFATRGFFNLPCFSGPVTKITHSGAIECVQGNCILLENPFTVISVSYSHKSPDCWSDLASN